MTNNYIHSQHSKEELDDMANTAYLKGEADKILQSGMRKLEAENAKRAKKLRKMLKLGKPNKHSRSVFSAKQIAKMKRDLEFLTSPQANEVKVMTPQQEAQFIAEGVTFNRAYHPATKFKGVVDYGKIQKQFIKEA